MGVSALSLALRGNNFRRRDGLPHMTLGMVRHVDKQTSHCCRQPTLTNASRFFQFAGGDGSNPRGVVANRQVKFSEQVIAAGSGI
jgi:hypothetical protein